MRKGYKRGAAAGLSVGIGSWIAMCPVFALPMDAVRGLVVISIGGVIIAGYCFFKLWWGAGIGNR